PGPRHRRGEEVETKKKGRAMRPSIVRRSAAQAFLTFSSILKMPFGEPMNMRLKVLGRQRRSSVLRRVRVRSAIRVLGKIRAAQSGKERDLTVKAPFDQRAVAKRANQQRNKKGPDEPAPVV